MVILFYAFLVTQFVGELKGKIEGRERRKWSTCGDSVEYYRPVLFLVQVDRMLGGDLVAQAVIYAGVSTASKLT